MGHSQMLETRRTKQKGKKDLARIAKRAKKLTKKNVTTAGAGATKQKSA
jgi:hypothetical protein